MEGLSRSIAIHAVTSVEIVSEAASYIITYTCKYVDLEAVPIKLLAYIYNDVPRRNSIVLPQEDNTNSSLAVTKFKIVPSQI
jgi:hypothetical protein